MRITVSSNDVTRSVADLLVVGCFRGETLLDAEGTEVDRRLSGRLNSVRADGDFEGRPGETILLYPPEDPDMPRVLAVGLGERSAFGPAAARNAAATAARRARKVGAKSLASLAFGVSDGLLEAGLAGQMIAEGTLLGLYRFAGHRSRPAKDQRPNPESLVLCHRQADRLPALQEGLARGEAIARGVVWARDVVNEPGNLMTPAALAAEAARLAGEAGLSVQILDEAEIEALGMGIFLAVAAESEQPPKFIILEHNPGRDDLPTVVLVGKGITFDTGGISLKPVAEMWRMKDDMAGAAAVVSALAVAARLKLPVHAVALAPCAENMPGGKSQKPGDVYTGMSGKTMEVITTDAEGRMVLADALAYAERFAATAVVDIATLTAAQIIAFGPLAAAFFTPDDALASRLEAAAARSGDRLWRMPLYEEYAEAIRSQVADVKNAGGKYGGLGTSAKILQHFTAGYPWAHIDMASMSWSAEDKPAQPAGATGFGVRLLVALLEGWCGGE